ncbi:DNA polymerase III delta subunit [Brevibacterium sanguinis]|uniref:DNA polymerase III subunit delta n=2 Tax=Brevibacterium TaxID=1696 RepID=A0A366IJ91_9MICO|nr:MULTISPECIES: DNA polymerase III subunit delta [Brevibacterium]RBP63945.1 DNA polymerase III delta subunit [Brevibacterium sanguinis]RBP70780.1 DNA polymerase III delta subunit [Brevibacterium celere]
MAVKKTLVPWSSAKPAPVVMISGSEQVLVRMAKDRIVAAARKKDPEEIDLDASSCQGGELAMAASPSLFSTAKLITVDAVEKCSEAFLDDALGYLDDPHEDTVLLLLHGGGNRGAKLVKKLDAAGYPRIDAAPLKNESDRAKFAQGRFKAAKRQIDEGGMAALMAALGSDLAELNAGIDQLVEDTTGTITAEIVDKYYGGRVEATGFKVADAAVSGDAGSALSLLRHALSTGSDPVPLVAAVAMKLRSMAKVQGFSGSSGELAAELKMAPWQVDRARREVRRWNEVALGQSLIAAAEADEAVKGGGRDPVYAVESFVAEVCRLAARR